MSKKNYYYRYGAPADSGLAPIGSVMLIVSLMIMIPVTVTAVIQHGEPFHEIWPSVFFGGMGIIGVLLLAANQMYKVGSIQERVPTGFRIVEVSRPSWKADYKEYAVQQRDAYNTWHDLSSGGRLLDAENTAKHISTFKTYDKAQDFLRRHMETHPVDIDYWEAKKKGLDAVLRRMPAGTSEKTVIEFT